MSIQPLNYSAHAIKDLIEFAELGPIRNPELVAPSTVSVVKAVIKALHDTPKFILPPYGHFVDNWPLALPSELHLPMPQVVLEFPAPLSKDTEIELRSSRRIALATQPNSEGPINIIAISYIDSIQRWMLDCWSANISMSNGPEMLMPARFRDRVSMQKLVQNAEGFRLVCSIHPLLRDTVDAIKSKQPEEKWQANAYNDLREEALVVAQFCEAMMCCNVSTTQLHPSAKLNKKRQARNLPPFYTYHVLMVDPTQEHSLHSEPLGGHHASPRFHLRRGHIRFLRKYQKRIFVRAHFVGEQARGAVHKDYSLKEKS